MPIIGQCQSMLNKLATGWLMMTENRKNGPCFVLLVGKNDRKKTYEWGVSNQRLRIRRYVRS